MARVCGERLFRILDRLVDPNGPYKVKSLQTFICDGIASKFADEEGLFRILDDLNVLTTHSEPS